MPLKQLMINYIKVQLLIYTLNQSEKKKYNERLKLPGHYHFEFRYLFTIDSAQKVKLDLSESSKFKWISIDELRKDKNYGKIVEKLKTIMLQKGSNYEKYCFNFLWNN